MAVIEEQIAPPSGGLVRVEDLPSGLPKLLSETWTLYVRQVKRLSRQPTIVVFSLIQPLIWLVLFGQMFSRIANFPNASQQFGSVSYLQFFIPTVMLQSVLFGAGQTGVGIITDIDSGFLDKLLTTPVNRLAILLGRILGDLTRMALQVVLVVLIGLAIGRFQTPPVSFAYGGAGILPAIGIALLFGLVLTGFNVFIALTTRSTEATFLLGNFITLPLLFTSSAQLPIALLPGWMQAVARVNPVTYAIDAMRSLLNGPGADEPPQHRPGDAGGARHPARAGHDHARPLDPPLPEHGGVAGGWLLVTGYWCAAGAGERCETSVSLLTPLPSLLAYTAAPVRVVRADCRPSSVLGGSPSTHSRTIPRHGPPRAGSPARRRARS